MLFEEYKKQEEFPEDCDTIWKYLLSKGTPLFDKEMLSSLWEEFSTEEYCAGFLIPYDYYIEEFIVWLKEKV